jgi:protein-tyrosine phosphatase
MERVTDRIWIGNAAAATRENLKAMGVTAVVNATKETDQLHGDPQIAYVRLDHDDGVPWPPVKLRTFILFMEDQLMVRGKTVLIHCGAGVSRASSLVIAWLMYCGFGWDEAEDLVRSKRPVIMPNPELKKSTLEFFGEFERRRAEVKQALQGGLMPVTRSKQEAWELVEKNLGLARMMARKYARWYRTIDYEDLYGWAVLALYDAAVKFDEARGTKFSTYAVATMRGKLQHAILRQALPFNLRWWWQLKEPPRLLPLEWMGDPPTKGGEFDEVEGRVFVDQIVGAVWPSLRGTERLVLLATVHGLSRRQAADLAGVVPHYVDAVKRSLRRKLVEVLNGK